MNGWLDRRMDREWMNWVDEQDWVRGHMVVRRVYGLGRWTEEWMDRKTGGGSGVECVDVVPVDTGRYQLA